MHRYSRLCNEDYSYKGITIPEGSLVFIPSHIIHKDAQYWEDLEIEI